MSLRRRALGVLVGLLSVASPAQAHVFDPFNHVPTPPEPISQLWMASAAANLIMAVTFAAIAWFLWKAAIEGEQLGSNPLLLGMAGIFTTCSLGHAIHFEHAMLPIYGPWLGLEAPNLTAEFGQWARVAMVHPVLLGVDLVTASLGVWYFFTRRRQAEMFQGAELAEDIRELEKEARVLQDSVVQVSTQAKLLLELGHEEEAIECLEEAIDESQEIVDEFLGKEAGPEMEPGELGRDAEGQAAPN